MTGGPSGARASGSHYAGSDEPAADVPIPPDLSRRYGGSSTGRDWLASLPRLVGQCLDQWQLELDLAPGALPWNGHGAIVVPVRHWPAPTPVGTPVAAPAAAKPPS